MVQVKVTTERTSQHRISPYILGNFIESGFGRQTSGMWSEMIYNRSFRPIPEYSFITWAWLGFEKEMYNDNAPFWHSGYEELDWELIAPECTETGRSLGEAPFKGNDSYTLTYNGKAERGGIRQRGIYLHAGEAYRFSLFGGLGGNRWDQSPAVMCYDIVSRSFSQGETKSVQIILRSEADPAQVIFEEALPFDKRMQQFDLTIESGLFEGRVVLEIVVDEEIELLLAWVSLMPASNIRGWRKDVVDLLKKLAPPVLRVPGGCFTSFFDWRNAAGPRDRREPSASYFWGGLDENDVGIDEYLDLCEEVGSEPQVCINMMTGSPFKAAELVEYCNGPDDSHMGRYRVENGVARKGRVRLWEMENEACRKWNAVQYAEKVVEFAVAMKAVDPDIELMVEYYTFGPDWLPVILDICGQHIDYVIHRNGSKQMMDQVLPVIREYNAKHGTNIRQVNTEWVSDSNAPEPFSDPDIPQHYSWTGEIYNDYKKNFSFRQTRWFYALNAAGIIVNYMSYGGEFYLANFNNCVNTWGQNVIEASKEGAWLSPAGRVFEFFRGFTDQYPLQTEYVQDSFVQALACETSDPNVMHLYVINKGTNSIDLEAVLPEAYKPYAAESLYAEDRLTTNRLNDDQVHYESVAWDGAELKLRPLSVNRISCRRES